MFVAIIIGDIMGIIPDELKLDEQGERLCQLKQIKSVCRWSFH